jgi:hypothetical protein
MRARTPRGTAAIGSTSAQPGTQTHHPCGKARRQVTRHERIVRSVHFQPRLTKAQDQTAALRRTDVSFVGALSAHRGKHTRDGPRALEPPTSATQNVAGAAPPGRTAVFRRRAASSRGYAHAQLGACTTRALAIPAARRVCASFVDQSSRSANRTAPNERLAGWARTRFVSFIAKPIAAKGWAPPGGRTSPSSPTRPNVCFDGDACR